MKLLALKNGKPCPIDIAWLHTLVNEILGAISDIHDQPCKCCTDVR